MPLCSDAMQRARKINADGGRAARKRKKEDDPDDADDAEETGAWASKSCAPCTMYRQYFHTSIHQRVLCISNIENNGQNSSMMESARLPIGNFVGNLLSQRRMWRDGWRLPNIGKEREGNQGWIALRIMWAIFIFTSILPNLLVSYVICDIFTGGQPMYISLTEWKQVLCLKIESKTYNNQMIGPIGKPSLN